MTCLEGCFAFGRAREPDLRVLVVNDVYKPERFALVRSLARGLRSKAHLLVLPGDLLGGSLFASEHRGQSTLEVLNATQVDYCVLGNHEFDYGHERLRQLMDMSSFQWLGSNVRESTERRPMFHKTLDMDVVPLPCGVKVGIFGLCTPWTPHLSHPGPQVAFEDPVSHARRPGPRGWLHHSSIIFDQRMP